MALALGMGSSLETHFGFGHVFWLRACLWKALRMQECVIVLGSRSFREGRGGKAEGL